MKSLPKYYVELGGQDDTFKNVSQSFKSENFRIIKKKDQWILESDEFEDYENYSQVLPHAVKVVKYINILLAIYAKLHNSVQFKNIVWLHSDGKYKRHITSSVSFEVYLSRGIDELCDLEINQSFGSKILDISNKNSKVEHLLSLITENPLKWGEIYDVIEFMGDSKGIEKWGFATKTEVNRIRRTANYYRHLGKPDQSILPSQLVSLKEAQEFAEELICKWLNKQVN